MSIDYSGRITAERDYIRNVQSKTRNKSTLTTVATYQGKDTPTGRSLYRDGNGGIFPVDYGSNSIRTIGSTTALVIRSRTLLANGYADQKPAI